MPVARLWACLLLLLPSVLAAEPPAVPATEDPGAALSQLIHQAVTAKLPKVYEDTSGWGHTIPLPETVRRPRLRRTIVEVDGRPEVPDGLWRKVRLRLEDPNRDLQIHVRSLERLDTTSYRLKVDADVVLHPDADVQRWRNGVLLADVTAKTRVALNVFVVCDVSARLEADSLPPRVRLSPEIKDLKLNLRDFKAQRVNFLRAGVTVQGPAMEGLNKEFKSALQDLLRAKEAQIKQQAGEALTRGLKEDKGPLAAGAWLKAVAPLLSAANHPRTK